MNFNLADLPVHLRRAIILALIGVFVVAVGAFSLSFSAQRAWAVESGLWPPHLAWVFPLLIDLFLLVAELALVVVSGVAYSRAVPVGFMALFAGLSIGFNLLHAPAEWAIQVTAAMPPVLTMCTSVLAATIVKATAKGLGKPLTHTTPTPTPVASLFGPAPGAYGYPHLPMGYLPPPGYGQLPPPAPQPQHPHVSVPSSSAGMVNPQVELPRESATHQEQLPTNGQTSTTDEAGRDYGAAARRVAEYLDELVDRGDLDETVTTRQVVGATGASPRTVQPILAEYKQIHGIPTGRSLQQARNGQQAALPRPSDSSGDGGGRGSGDA